MKLLLAFIACLLLVALPGCAAPAPATKGAAYVSIDEGGYPVFNLHKAGDPGNVKIPATKEQIAKWKAAFVAYEQAQKELGDAVNHYQPLAIDKKKTKK